MGGQQRPYMKSPLDYDIPVVCTKPRAVRVRKPIWMGRLLPDHAALRLVLRAIEAVPEFVEAAAANKAWQSLLTEAVDNSVTGDEAYRQALTSTFGNAMKSFSDLLTQIEEMDAEPSEDSYAWETMSESLVSVDTLLIRE